jgi:hypothetical protein
VKDRREAISASFVILSAGLPESKDLAPLASRVISFLRRAHVTLSVALQPKPWLPRDERLKTIMTDSWFARSGLIPNRGNALSPELIRSLASDLRRQRDGTQHRPRCSAAGHIAEVMAKAFAEWRSRDYNPRRELISALGSAHAATENFHPLLLDRSLDAMLAPFTREAPRAIAEKSPQLSGHLIGFVMAGNVVGAGLHELVQTLIAGASVLIKTSSAEPFFFSQLAHTIAELDPEIGDAMAVLNWSRSDRDLTDLFLQSCDVVVAYGDDTTVEWLGRGSNSRVIGFNSRLSCALIAAEAAADAHLEPICEALAQDISLFEQRGCLSPHHVFVTGAPAQAHRFAAYLASALDRIDTQMPAPRHHPLEDSAAVRHLRETVRWRKLAGQTVDLWEGDRLAWTVVYDPAAEFCISPLLRTITVSCVQDASDLQARIRRVAGRLEGVGIADLSAKLDAMKAVLHHNGASYFCPPGNLQSPPLSWQHGGRDFMTDLNHRLVRLTLR